MTDDVRPLFSLFEGCSRSGLSWRDLWLRQLTVGGTIGEVEIEAYVLGLLKPDAYQHDVIAQALNEHFLDLGQGHPVAYSDDPAPSD